MRGIIVLTLVLLAACAQAPDIAMQDMPCHQMADGTWMGECDAQPTGHDGMQENGFLPESSREEAVPTQIIDIQDGSTILLTATPVQKTIAGEEFTMYGYNGMVPGPVLRAKQGSEFNVTFKNRIGHDTTVHWHGLRHDNKDDGVAGITQPSVVKNGTYTYTVRVPDDGIYWYHPHVREDMQQDMGLAGTIHVLPENTQYNPVNREEILVLDDILVRNGQTVPYGLGETANFALMGRYGNVLLVNGDADYELDVHRGEVVRFYIANVANVRPYNFSINGAQMKLVGSDLGLYEREEFIDSIIIAPAERYIVEAYFPIEGEYDIMNANPHKTYVMGKIIVRDGPAQDHSDSFAELRINEDVSRDIGRFSEEFDRPADRTFTLTLEMPMMDMGEVHAESIEWEDEMGRMNEMHTSEIVKWILRDEQGLENMDASFNSSIGDVMKIRLINTQESMHPMQHPIHLHGQRFVVTHVDGKPVENKVWKDTVLVPAGSTIDILVDVTNPGEWMLHCHIAEHLTAGMMTSMNVI